jgi:hypothetical protein
MAVTYRLCKQAVPYKTRLTGWLMSKNEGSGATTPGPSPISVTVNPLGHDISPGGSIPALLDRRLPCGRHTLAVMLDRGTGLSVRGDYLEPLIALRQHHDWTYRRRDHGRRLRGLTHGGEQRLVGRTGVERSPASNRLWHLERRTYHRRLYRIFRLKQAR